MATLNERTEETKKIIHLLVTEKCIRNCPLCCNKQYDMDSIETVTEEEYKEAEEIFLTGGEPFLFTNPAFIAGEIKVTYPNIKKVYVYTNAFELGWYLKSRGNFSLPWLDGVTVSIKNDIDKYVFESYLNNHPDLYDSGYELSNYLYVFKGFEDIQCNEVWKKIPREWQVDFTPATDSIFRKVQRDERGKIRI